MTHVHPQSRGMKSDDWWVVKQWATHLHHITFARMIFSRRQHNKQRESSDWLGWSIASFFSSRLASVNREWCQWTGRHFQSSLRSTWWIIQRTVLSSTQPQRCVVTIDVQNSRWVPWNKLVEKTWYRTRIRQTTQKQHPQKGAWSILYTVTLSIRSIHNGRYPAQPDFSSTFPTMKKGWICGPVLDGPLWTTHSVECYGYLQAGK